MPKLTVIARIFAKPEHSALVKRELIKLIAPTRAEEGCINYDLHQDNENPNLFLFYENWESRELLEKHLLSAHIQAYSKATEGAVENLILEELTAIG